MVHKKIFLSLAFFLFFWVGANVQAQSLEQYCKDGYYKLENEPVCSRAPNCGGRGYDDVYSLPMPDPQKCMAENEAGCRGWVPLCCYEVARTGDFTKCTGYWERLWCAPVQCTTARSRGASDAQCGGDCRCGSAFNNYCGDKPPVPLQDRLAARYPYGSEVSAPAPEPTLTPTPSPRPPTPTFSPVSTPTSTPRPTRKIPTPTPTAFETKPTLPDQIVTDKPFFSPTPTVARFPFPQETEQKFTPSRKRRVFSLPKLSLPEIRVEKESVKGADEFLQKITEGKRKLILADRYLELRINFYLRRFFAFITDFLKGI